MSRVNFFAAGDDLLAVYAAVDTAMPLRYVRMGHVVGHGFEEYAKGSDLPGLGMANFASSSLCTTFLVMNADMPVVLREIPGTDRKAIDQMYNPDSVTLHPAGTWGDRAVLSGCVATAYDSVVTRALIGCFRKAIRRHFTKVRAFYVGPAAMALLHQQARLTAAIQCPIEGDLTLPPGDAAKV